MAFLVFVVLIGATAAGVIGAVFGGDGTGCAATVTTPGASPPGLTAEQARNAGVIVAEGERMRVPVRGWVIAVATALQESNLINLRTPSDHDSLGLFQQRPSQGWGTPAQIMSPDYAAGKFYERLLVVPGWQSLPLTVAAQKVQRSAYPDAYAKHEPRASVIVAAFTGGTMPVCDNLGVSPAGWARPVAGDVGSGFRTPERPGHDGTDIMADRGTVIRAASAGVVVRVRCNAGGGSWDAPFSASMPCDTDGYPGLGGCGWYVEVRHAGDIVSRYCHMVRQPIVQVSQSVTAGQPIGYVGTSGNSSGPHLHYEVHQGYPATESNATDPVSFMISKGVRL
ncbi:murein DD-endopeptidase MepM/ murein hydrolase activator NlpD [Actinoplanes lutulentus]|nr:M23 family metallopeptidase [Actinoplanes lutulentus]MBB2943241.1 murein DD-endopeptidase MepM/ murein hydrolase activator NlpD [Actinoplanes lutulentus]